MAPIIRSASTISSGVLRLKKGSNGSVENSAKAAPCWSVQATILRKPSCSAARRSWRRSVGHSPKVGWRSAPRSGCGVAAKAMGLFCFFAALVRFSTRSAGKKGVSAAAVMMWLWPYSAAQSRPARTPARGPGSQAESPAEPADRSPRTAPDRHWRSAGFATLVGVSG